MKKKKLKVIIALSIIVAVAVGGYAVKASKPKTKAVSTSLAVNKNLVQMVTATGNIEPNDKYEMLLSPTQKITEVYVKEGQTVKAAESLLKLDTSDTEYQLQKSSINLEISKAALEKLSSNDTSSLESAIKQAEINLQNAKNASDDAAKKLSQNEELFKNGFVSKTEYDAAKKAVTDAQNQVKLAQIQLDNAKKSLTEGIKNNGDQINSQKKQIELATADIAYYKNKLGSSLEKAQIGGKIIEMDAKAGEYPKNGDKISIQDISSYKIKLQLTQYDVISLKLGQKADIKVKGLEKKYTGKVVKIGDVAEEVTTGTTKEYKVPVEIAIDEADEAIKSGYEADVEIILTERQSTLTVNADVVKEDENGKPYVLAVEGNKIVKKPIQTGIETDYEIEVTQGLKEGDKCIINPADTLKEGEIVTVGGQEK